VAGNGIAGQMGAMQGMPEGTAMGGGVPQ
jgi:hypothetical protein